MTPIITIYSFSIMPWALIACQLLLIAIYLENRSWKYGYLSPTGKIDEHTINIFHCECVPPSSDPYLQKHPERPLMTQFYQWEGFIYASPTLIFFGYLALKLSSYQHKFRQNAQSIIARRNANAAREGDDDMFLHLQEEKEANQQIIDRILWFLPTPLGICIKLSFGVTDQFNWYVVFTPAIITCIIYMTEGYRHNVWWFREQRDINRMLNENSANMILENAIRRNENEEDIIELQAILNDTTNRVNIDDDDEENGNVINKKRNLKGKEEEEEEETKRKEEEEEKKQKKQDEKLQSLNLYGDTDF